MTRREREALRERYRPERVRLLFIGEAPPASDRFFYSRDSGLYRAIREAFQAVDAGITDESFLETFRSRGCYFADLCPNPVDRLAAMARRRVRERSEPLLAGTLAELQPAEVAIVLRSISGNVAAATARAGWTGTMVELPYPGRWSQHRSVFLQALTPRLRELV